MMIGATSLVTLSGAMTVPRITVDPQFDIAPIEDLQRILADTSRGHDQAALRQHSTGATDSDTRVYYRQATDRQGKPMLAEQGCLYTDLRAGRRVRLLVAEAAKTPGEARRRLDAYDEFRRKLEENALPRLAHVAALLGSSASAGDAASLRQAAIELSRLEQEITAESISRREDLGGDAQTWALTPLECRISYLAVDIVDTVFGKGDAAARVKDDKDFADASFLLLQHLGRRPDVQKQYLPVIERGARAGLFAKDRYALLFDRLAVSDGGVQRFGTQFALEQSGCVGLPSSDRKRITSIDAERRRLGLEPLAAYARGLAEAYQAKPCAT